VIRELFSNWRFRSSTPGFAPGTVVRAYLTGFDENSGEGTARVGDTILAVSGASATNLDQLVDLRVESFDAQHATGRAVLEPRVRDGLRGR
jgi:hypothetical protein